MAHVQTVINAARKLSLLDGNGKLIVLDSLAVIDLVTELEDVMRLSIPPEEINTEVFRSVEDIAALLDRLAT